MSCLAHVIPDTAHDIATTLTALCMGFRLAGHRSTGAVLARAPWDPNGPPRPGPQAWGVLGVPGPTSGFSVKTRVCFKHLKFV